MKKPRSYSNSKKNVGLLGIANKECLLSFKGFFEGLKEGSIPFYKRSYESKADYLRAWKKTSSIISFGVSYNAVEPLRPHDEVLRGKIARSGRGVDYHIELKRRAEMLMQRFCKKYNCEYKIFVDTGALSDRAVAYSAGLGFYGKNNFIINPRYGSFIYLGHILCDIQLTENTSFSECMCGVCEKCLMACPKKANGKRLLEYKKCISYITQSDIRADSSGYIYGCDICQEVCPFNATALTTESQAFSCSAENAYPSLEEVISCTKEEFESRFSCSSMLWVGFERIRKNCLNLLYPNGAYDNENR